MPHGPVSKIVIKRPNGRTEIIGRGGHIDLQFAARTFAQFGEVVTVRHEMTQKKDDGGNSHLIAIHNTKRAR